MTIVQDLAGPWLLVLTLAAPTALLIASLSRKLRSSALALQWLAPIPGLIAAAAALIAGPISLEAPAIRLSLRLDTPGALLLAMSALLWIVVSAQVFWARGERRPPLRFAISWLLTMIGSLGVFIAGDLLSFYLVYALVSIPAYGMIVSEETASARRAGAAYMAFTILGEALLLFAFAMLAAGEPSGSLRISDVVAALPGSPWRDPAIALLIAGFGMKMGLAPFNSWMPLAYSAAPIPAAAVLSGAGVKAGVIGLIRFLPLGAPLLGWGEALIVLGFVSAFYGVAIGVTQRNPRAILAYSSISQMGVIAAALGAALSVGDARAASLAAFYAANHILVKGALFLTIGAFAAKSRSAASLALAGALALSLAGLPLTGGALAKIAVKPVFGSGLATWLAGASSAASALLMLRFVACLAGFVRIGDDPLRLAAARFWPAAAGGAILIPYLLFPIVGDAGDAVKASNLWDGLWPILIGAILAAWLSRNSARLPEVPEGDSLVAYEVLFRQALRWGAGFERVDASLRRWPAGGLMLLAIALVLMAATAFARL